MKMMGGSGLMKKQAKQITNLLEEMKKSDAVKNSIEKEGFDSETKKVESISINIFSNKNGETRINFAYLLEKEKTIFPYEKHTISTLVEKSQMLSLFVPIIENLMKTTKNDFLNAKMINEDERISLSITNEYINNELQTVIVFRSMEKNTILKKLLFAEILEVF